jgi:decaprenylphospho-beta-D-erythro-pentofuranosid-2-ulose 2-reductase
MEENILILGATSDMAVAIARKFASQGHSITLAARSTERMQTIAADLKVRFGGTVHCVKFDALNFSSHAEFYQTLPEKPDTVACVFGLLGDQQKAQTNWDECENILFSNYVGAVSILNIVANDFEKRRKGTIIGISSVAGDRGRQSNYFYGSAKAGFTAYLSGLRNRLYHAGVHVLTVKPGFVKTRMIENMKTPGPITATTSSVADKVYKGAASKTDSLYVLPVWSVIMLVIKTIPERFFKRLKL